MSSVVAFGLVLALVGLLRLVELAVSARRARGRPVVVEPGAWVAMVLLHVASVTAPVLEVVLLDRPLVPWLTAAALVVLALATGLRVWALGTLGKAWNVRVVVPDEQAVVTTGPYAWIRHPNYLVVILELAALPLLHGAWLSSLVLSAWNGLVLARRIPTEEAALARSPAWRAAMADRPRFVPRPRLLQRASPGAAA